MNEAKFCHVVEFSHGSDNVKQRYIFDDLDAARQFAKHQVGAVTTITSESLYGQGFVDALYGDE